MVGLKRLCGTKKESTGKQPISFEFSRGFSYSGDMKNHWALLLFLVFISACAPEALVPSEFQLPTPAADWRVPPPDASWQIQYSGEFDGFPAVEVLNLDLFDTTAEEIAALHGQRYHIICYFSAGSREDWRPDAAAFPAETLGRKLQGWPGERWLDIRQIDLLAPIIRERLDLAAEKGCDAVDPDNVNAYQNASGFDLSAADQLAFNRWLAAEAHSRGLGIGLKNDLDQIPALVDEFDFAVNEQCFDYGECEAYQPFVDAGKAVFQIEYDLAPEEFCLQAQAMGLRSLRKSLELGAEWEPCR